MKYVSFKGNIALVILSTLTFISSQTIAKPIYLIENLGTIGSPESDSTAFSLNESGQVVGTYQDENGNSQAYVWDALNGMQSLGTLGGNSSVALDINNHGQIVGNSTTDIEGQESGFIYENGTMTQIIDLIPSIDGGIKSSDARGINDTGQILGSYHEVVFNNEFQFFEGVAGETFLITGDNIEFSGRLVGDESPNSSVSSPGVNALNENGDYTGIALSTNELDDNFGGFEAFVKKSGEDIEGLGSLGGVAFGFDVNDNNTVVGRSRLEDREEGYHAFIYSEVMGMVDMNDLFGFQNSNLRNINNNNIAVGWGSDNFNNSDEDAIFAPFLFDVNLNQTFFLNDFLTLDSDFISLDFAYSINEDNDIVGYGTTIDGNQRAFLMTYQVEVPAPSTISIMITTLLLLVFRRKFNYV